MANSKQIPMANSKQIPMTLSQPKPAQSQPPKTPRKKQAPKTPSRKSARTQQTDEVEPPSKQAIIKTYSRSSRESDSQDSRQSVDIPRKQHMIVKVPPQKPTVTIKKNPGSKLMAPQPIQAPSPMPSPIQKNSTMSQVSQLSYQSPHCTQSSLMLLNSAISIKPIAPKQQDSSATPPKWFEEYMRKFVNPKLDLINSKLDVILDKMVGQQRSIADNHHY